METFCIQENIPVFFPDRVSTPENEAILSGLQPDLLVVIAFGQILKPSFYNLPRYGAFNLHFSLLPKYRGASPVPASILNGDTESGITIQKISEKLDEGDIARQVAFDIRGLNATKVFEKSIAASLPLFEKFFAEAPESFSSLIKQDAAKATYCGKIQKESGHISAQASLLQTGRMLRAFDPWPGIFLVAEGRRIQVVELGECKMEAQKEWGFVERTNKWEMTLVLADGRAAITKLKPEGKRVMTDREYLNSHPASFRWKI